MTTTRTRTLLAGTATAILAAGLVAPAAASTAADRLAAGPQGAVASGDHERVPDSAVTAGVATSRTARLAAAVPVAACPNGGTRTVISATGFDGGNLPADTYGWFGSESGLGGSGDWSARSSQVPGSATPEDHQLFLDPIAGASASTTYLSFASRGDDVFDNVFFGVNDEVYGMDLSAGWERVTVDVTAATSQYGGDLDAFFVHQAGSSQSTFWEVDDVSVFRCGAPPASGVRGDWTGEGTVDVLATNAAGELVLYPGTTTGAVGEGRTIGQGWGSMTWIGSPGDINGDRRTDLLARGNGRLPLPLRGSR